jgi:N-acetylmuramoyl-L-alanine amidase
MRGLIAGMRYGTFRTGNARVVLDLAGPAAVAKSFVLPPAGAAGHRIVIDFKPTTRDAFLAALRGLAPPPMPAPQAAPAAPAQKRPPGGKRVVVIDPGHGGIDPGAIGPDGSYEKDITLAQAQVLRRALVATGRYEVVLTRERDTFVALRERFRIAGQAQAEAFLSLHADALSDHQVRGGSVYTLSENASDAEAAALAAKENRADALAGIDLSDHSPPVAQILIELTQRMTMNASAVLAKELVSELRPVTRLLHNTHRFAGFAVLKSPEVPSVLIEMGYLSNRADERQLSNPKFRADFAAAVVRALDAYFAGQQPLKRP